jgi:hypothetical protein
VAADKTTAATADQAALGAVIARGITEGLSAIAPPREIKEGDPEYVARQRAEGWFDDFFGKTVFQNAYEAQARGLSEEVRRRASALEPGTYIKGRVRVETHKNGEVIRILYPVSGDNLQKNRDYWNDFSDLINKIWAEMHATVAA